VLDNVCLPDQSISQAQLLKQMKRLLISQTALLIYDQKNFHLEAAVAGTLPVLVLRGSTFLAVVAFYFVELSVVAAVAFP
jgi:hypothetical protein